MRGAASLVLPDKGLDERPNGLRNYRRTFGIGVANGLWYHERGWIARYGRLDLWRRVERAYVLNCKQFWQPIVLSPTFVPEYVLRLEVGSSLVNGAT